MYLIINELISLESFVDMPYAYHLKGSINSRILTKEEYELLLKCDGHTFINDSDLSNNLILKGLCKECAYKEKRTIQIKQNIHKNSYMPKMNLQITGRCNYNCRHCFNAKDNLPLQSELSFIEICHLLDECEKCGIYSFTITGGEPLIHPQYREIIEEIYKRGMNVFELNTNGYFITEEMLDWMKSINYIPLIKISFDGISFHNWMRGSNVAEDKTLYAIKLCVDKGFDVKVQMNINKKNVSSIISSLIMLDKMGVKQTRIIKTSKAPRWIANAEGENMSYEEYYDEMLNILKEYLKEERKMVLSGWLICRVDPKEKYYNLIPVTCRKDEFNEYQALCNGVTKMIGVGSNGNVYPCLQTQGYFDQQGIILGNVITDGLEKILINSDYKNMISLTVKDRLKASVKCRNCEFLHSCIGGCPAVAILTNGNYVMADGSKCIFFKKGYYQRFVEAIPADYKNIKPL